MKRDVAFLAFALAVVACGAAPATGPRRESGQSALMDKTFAGANKCSPKTHERPFIIEWDATDMSSFEAKAASDVVFVKYEGCDLQILDGCADDSVRGSLGRYGAVDWTSGSVEKIDIADEGELYAKLPLGASSLAGRVSAGEQFHMEYYVSGTRKATREDIWRKDLDAIPRCKGATHFVYAYNLGAFALGSAKQVKAEAGGTVWGIGAGGKQSSLSSAEKKGGVLTACAGSTARETQTCTVPIRLALRAISDGESPDATAARAPETPDAMNLAAKAMRMMETTERAKGLGEAVLTKMNAGDGKGCLKDLDAMDKLDPARLSTTPKSPNAITRGICVMLAGQCDAGRAQVTKAYQAQTTLAPELVDVSVDAAVQKYCQASTMPPRQALLKASQALGAAAAMQKKDAPYCTRTFETIKRLAPTVPADPGDTAVTNAQNIGYERSALAMCLARAGDCPASFDAWKLSQEESGTVGPIPMPESARRESFGTSMASCKTWAGSQKLSARDEMVRAVEDLKSGINVKKDVAFCKRAYETAKRTAPSVNVDKASDPEAFEKKQPPSIDLSAALCLGKAGDCAAGAAALDEAVRAMGSAANRGAETSLRGMFQNMTPCKK
jgi:hypothetical protein